MANRELVQEALKNATPAQLIRVRGLISRKTDRNAMADLNPVAYRANKALEAFDAKKYEDPCIAYVLNDTELGEALR